MTEIQRFKNWKINMWPRQESNLDLELRKLLYYPLYYEAGTCCESLVTGDYRGLF